MSKGISTIKLVGILVALGLIYVAIQFFGSPSRSKSFKEKLVEIDTAKVTRLVFSKAGTTLEVLKDGVEWKVKQESKEFLADKQKVKGALSTLLTIIPSRIVSNNPDKWRDFQVDSTGIQVIAYEGDKKTLDLIIGRFEMNNQREFLTYVRLSEDKNVYSADNFMSFSLSQESKHFRNNRLARLTRDSIQNVLFNYGDNSFTLSKTNNKWQIDGVVTDSTATVNFLRDISFLTNINFVDKPDEENSTDLTTVLIRSSESTDPVEIKALPSNEYKWIFNSSQNPTEYFADSILTKKVLKTKEYFLSE